MEKIVLEKREITGSKVKQLRDAGKLPAVVYNSKGDSHPVSMDAGLATKLVQAATSTTLVDAQLGKKTMKVVLKEVDTDPRTGLIRHISMFEVDENKVMTFTVPFELTGISPAVKNNLGVLVSVLDAVDVRCKPKDLVDTIKVDVTGLEHPGQNIIVSDIELPEGMELPNEDHLDSAIAAIVDVQKQMVVEEEETDEEVDGEEGEEGAEGEEATEDGEAPAEEENKEE